jgi:hypothetical protein
MDAYKLAWALAQSAGTPAKSLADAYTSGTFSVRFADGRQVQYREIADIAAAIVALYDAQISGVRRPVVTFAAVNRYW